MLLALLLVGVATRVAHAEKKRVVVLTFDGDENAKKFRAAVIKLLKQKDDLMVVSNDKWEKTAEDMSASKLDDKNIQKVAKKLKVDGIVEGTIKKKGDEYTIKLKLHAGTTGKQVGKVDTKAESSKLEGGAKKEIKDELIAKIDELKSNDEGGDEEKPKKVKKDDEKPKGDDEKPKGDDEKPKKSKFGKATDENKGDEPKGDDEKPHKTKKGGDEEANKGGDDEKPKKKRRKKDVAATEGNEVSGKSEDNSNKYTGAEAVTPAHRAVDFTLGISLVARRLSWKADGDLASGAGTPPGMGKPHDYKGVPAPGAVLDMEFYPMAFSHKTEKSPYQNIGVTAFYDKALLISSKTGDGTKLKTAAQRYMFGAAYRYPLGSLTVGGTLGYGKTIFQIEDASDLPNVAYSTIQLGGFIKMPIIPKITAGVDLGFQLIGGTGEIGKTTQYGKGGGTGILLNLGVDYALSPKLFARGSINIDRIGTKFNGTGDLTKNRDGDMEQDVQGATDLYAGVLATVGFLY